jgi:hypothetical protein
LVEEHAQHTLRLVVFDPEPPSEVALERELDRLARKGLFSRA